MARKELAIALCCQTDEIPIRQAINCALESIWDHEQRQSDKVFKGITDKVMESLKEDF